MKHLFFLMFGLVWTVTCLQAQQIATELFISEYCEFDHTATDPRYYNHYIELYNGTGETIDMSQFQLWRAMNGGGWNIDDTGTDRGPLNLEGNLDNNKTYVITRPNTAANPISIEAVSDIMWDFMNISGDDAIGLAKNDGNGNFILIDVVGTPDSDPGNYWSVAGYANGTQNRTIIRKPNVCSPNINWAVSAGTTAENSEWIVLPSNDISDIGQHNCQCNGIEPIDTSTSAVRKLSALFIGNSYTYYNDLPILIDRLANSTGDTLMHNESYPGGYRLSQHYDLAATQNLLKAKAYDYVVLQEQSQRPAIDSSLFFEYAVKFDSIRRIFSPCGQTMFYMTWGRKNGDANNCATNPDVCTYEGMDSVLCARYVMAQKKVDGLIAPVGRVRNYIIHNYPEIELYVEDESHPSPEGSFVSAVTFYTVMFKKDPTLTSYNYSLSHEVASIIKQAAKAVVFDVLSDWNTYAEGADSTISMRITYPEAVDTLILAESYTAEVEASSVEGIIDHVAFYLNGVNIGDDSVAPYTASFKTSKSGINNLIVIVNKQDGRKNYQRVDFYVRKQTTGISELLENQRFRIFPNPAETVLNIHIEKSFNKGSFSIHNLSGKKIQSGELSSTNVLCDISGLALGIYVLKIQLDDRTFYEKFSKH